MTMPPKARASGSRLRPLCSPMAVESVIEDPRWADLDIETLARRAASEALAQLGLDPEAWDISLLACSDARIANLNAEFRGMVQATNVLSWPSAERGPDTPGAVPDPPDPTDPELGDIALAYETCAREAEAAGLGLNAHATHLLVHGVLHLLGYDHENDADATRMETLETEILARLGVADPY